ncbi:tRNA pseudouridine synthase Pus10 isoform X2 [Pituophis catenifer annectens]|uniref:tRNA pseudouridine synthase Pus10 isoform X2 n=1 Tax=Pituophis catenifer annectens TaxID=94852 RepID=UPI00399676C0
MVLLAEKDRPVAQMLLNSGTCPRCIFRFCGVGLQTSYRQPHKDLFHELCKFLDSKKDENILSCEMANPPCKKIKLENANGIKDQNPNGSHELNDMDNDGSDAPAIENLNPVVCNICLGILQDLCEIDFVKDVCHKINSSEYQFSSFVFSVSFPPQLSVREHAACLLVKEEMGKQGLSIGKDDFVQLKEAYKWLIHPLFLEELGVPADGKSLFEVSVVFAHPETDEDCCFLASVCPSCFKPAKNKQSVFTRMAVVKALDMIDEEEFHKNYPSPASSPKTPCTAIDIQCNNGAIFVAGRYNKYSRTLPQTPWIIDGERKMESSVEELILEHLMLAFKADSFNFSSSGREDVDVRTLGNGRPFAVELVNPRKVQLTAVEMKELQQRGHCTYERRGRREDQVLQCLNMDKESDPKGRHYVPRLYEGCMSGVDLKLDQKTPLRVLHRRPLAVRIRVIHSMQSKYIDEHHFRLHLKTQAGTYVKEFVHGDFGRTKPNIGFLLKTTADILELDVESVDVDWPPALND